MDVDEENDGPSPAQEIDFCTLGMFIIDEIHFLPPKPPVYDILGGAGAYAALGARLFSPSPLSKTVSWIVDTGSDFPSSISSQIKSWNTSCRIRPDPSRLTTRGWNGYDENQNRGFKYMTPKLRLDENSLTDALLFSKSFHLICSPSRCIALTNSILRRRKRLNPRAPKPIFIWEPVPDLCRPTELLNTTNALPYVDICSPNHHELATLMGDPDLGLNPVTGEISTTSVERACEQLLGSMPLQSYALVIRCGAKGCYIAKNGGRSRRPSVIRKKRPANHARGGLTPEVDMMALFSGLMNADVLDPTGGGNAFLGGLSLALARGQPIVEAAAWGSVAASFAIEQVGVPSLGLEGGAGVDARSGEEPGEEGRETWNGVVVAERLEAFLRRAGLSGGNKERRLNG
ncbi:pfkB family carbohydrate kinase-like protein [Amylocarpus encephaloides]|uniref:PfkB family carbohydrate kinase-like protein n=1 Tax=Amylocarpus encephaloides TaxID=45428 RepID=A0A9P7YSL5_9HELO|nr:pfkB family carbohydrate kinase-like protein [Amylocarpus encephaloides]